MAVMGLILEMMGMDWRTALTRKTTLESLRNCRRMDLGRKVIRLYFAVSTRLPKNC
jgi:hypothetical protein